MLTLKSAPAISPSAIQLSEFIQNRVLDTSNLFSSDAERNALLFGILKRQGQGWQKPTNCYFRGCRNKSITRSHTIQRAGPLNTIAENNHVLTPQWTPNGMLLKRIGLKEASTFPGFCTSHEMLFDAFEVTGVITSSHDLDLQIFRSLCCEIARQKHKLDVLRSAKSAIVAKLDIEIRVEAARLGVEFVSYSFEGGTLRAIDDAIKISRGALSWLEKAYGDHFPAVAGTGSTRLVGEAAQINVPLPVALSGLTHFTSAGRSNSTLVGVIPQAAGALIYMVGRSGSRKAITSYMKNKAFDLCLLDIVEAWMIMGTDHWFLKPSVWTAIPPDRQAILLREMRDTEFGIDQTPATSVFDGLRKVALAVAMNPEMQPPLRDYIAAQEAKIRGEPIPTAETDPSSQKGADRTPA